MDPNIYIYSFPALQVRAPRLFVSVFHFEVVLGLIRTHEFLPRCSQIVKVLRSGTTYAYSDLTFNASGDKLASVGSTPDFMLTVWDWENER